MTTYFGPLIEDCWSMSGQPMDGEPIAVLPRRRGTPASVPTAAVFARLREQQARRPASVPTAAVWRRLREQQARRPDPRRWTRPETFREMLDRKRRQGVRLTEVEMIQSVKSLAKPDAKRWIN